MILEIQDGNLALLDTLGLSWTRHTYWVLLKGKRLQFVNLNGYRLNNRWYGINIVRTASDQPFTIEYGQELTLVPIDGVIIYPRVSFPWCIDIKYVWRPELHWIEENKQIETWFLVANRFGISRDIQILVAQFIHE